MSMRSFESKEAVRLWFKFNKYNMPLVNERPGDYKLRWSNRGNLETAKGIAEKLKSEGYVVEEISGSDDSSTNFMRMRIMKVGKTRVDLIREKCHSDLKIGMPEVKEGVWSCRLKWYSSKSCEEILQLKVQALKSASFEVLDARLLYKYGDVSIPIGYSITVKNNDVSVIDKAG